MAKEICISTTPHETRLAILEDDLLAEIYYERENEYTLAGSIYKGRVTRVLPGMQSSFVDIGLERDAFLYVTDFLEEQEDSEEYASDGNGGGRRESRGRADAGEESQPQARQVDIERSSGDRNQERSPERNQERSQERGRRPGAGSLAQQPAEGGRAARERVREQAVAPLREAVPAAQDLEEKGDDEAPEGTRRWRGRRGRRRGVRGGLPKSDGRAALAISPEVAEEADAGGGPFPIVEHGAPGGVAALRESTGGRSLGSEQEWDSQPESAGDRGSHAAIESSLQDHPLHRPAREADQAASRPRQIDGALIVGGTIVLPGESLAKYGSAPADPAVAPPAATATVPRNVRPVNYIAPKPSTLVEPPSDWDGGAVLPGETLSRYREPLAASVASVASIAGSAGLELGAVAEPEFAAEPELVAAPEVDASEQAVSAEPAVVEALSDEGAAEYSMQPLPADDELAGSSLSEEAEPGAPVAHEWDSEATIKPAPPGDASAIYPALEAESAEPELAEPEAARAAELAPLAEPEIVAAAVEPGSVASDPAVAEPIPATEVAEPALADETETQVPADAPQRELEEYEPSAASASYRVQLTGPSELRLPTPDAEEAESEEIHQPGSRVSGEPVIDVFAERDLAEPAGALTRVEEQPAPEFVVEPAPEQAFSPEAASGGVPEFAGTLAAQSAPEALPPDEPEPWPAVMHGGSTLQILHEDGTIDLVGGDGHPADFARLQAEPAEVVHDALEAPGPEFEAALSHVAESQAFQPHATEFSDLVDRLQGFSPGQGLLEEETIDEEEYDFEPMHAHADDGDQEDLEEETLDHSTEGLTLGETTRHAPYTEPRLAEQRPAQGPVPMAFVTEEEEEEEHGFGYEEVEDGDESEEDSEAEEAAPSPQPGEPRRVDDARNRGRGRSGGRNGGRRNGAPGRGRSAQTQDLPIITDLLKQGQEILVQIAKEPIAKKGARITSHIALPGRFLVFMPTVHHVGVSRKIASDEERQRLKRILISEKGESSGGFIVRTAAEGASEEDLRADLRFLISLWAEIKQRSDTAKAPALIYHDLNLIERILRDQVSSNFSTIWVDSEVEYERIIRFLSRFQPQLVRRVKLYTKETPLFEHFGIQEEISKALKSKVWLKSGGSIVINQTEALVAIDINTGKYVGRTARLEDTIVKTNLDAIPEIVRQIRLRDLGGIIVIDFIDMDERKNRNRVLAALEEELKNDRAPSKVLQFNDFGLVAITRKRVKQSLERTLSVQCDTCTGTGMVKSPITVCNEIYIEMRKMQKHLDGKDVMLRVHPEVVKQLKSGNGKWINELEELVAKTIIIKSDAALHPEQFDIH